MDIPKLRLLNQQLSSPLFHSPKELVSWMGAVQAQDYAMAKWAIGVRLKSASLAIVEQALQKGEIVRTHVMRPTWHFVAAEDLRWMLKLSEQRIKTVNDTYAKGRGIVISDELYSKSNRLLEKILAGKRKLTRPELAEEFGTAGLPSDNYHMTRFTMRAEVEGVICGGESKGGKHTYMLLEECIPPMPDLTKDEALARLARNYFRSHAPGALEDFIWWSGLTAREAQQAVYLIERELTVHQQEGKNYYVHDECRVCTTLSAEHPVLLPSYDEYLLGYKSRTEVLPLEYYPKAFTRNGLFFPVILAEGQVVGNWNRTAKKGKYMLECSFFRQDYPVNDKLLESARERCRQFWNRE